MKTVVVPQAGAGDLEVIRKLFDDPTLAYAEAEELVKEERRLKEEAVKVSLNDGRLVRPLRAGSSRPIYLQAA